MIRKLRLKFVAVCMAMVTAVMAVVLFYIAICNFERCLSYIHSSQPLKLLCPLTHIYDDMVRINGVSCPPKPFCGINSDVQRPV